MALSCEQGLFLKLAEALLQGLVDALEALHVSQLGFDDLVQLGQGRFVPFLHLGQLSLGPSRTAL